MGIFSKTHKRDPLDLATTAEHIVYRSDEQCLGKGWLRGQPTGNLAFIGAGGIIGMDSVLEWGYGATYEDGSDEKSESKNFELLTIRGNGFSIPEEFAGLWIIWLETFYPKT